MTRLFLPGEFFFGNDPGHTNLGTFVLFYLDWEYKLYIVPIEIRDTVMDVLTFTKGDYFAKSGVNKRIQLTKQWDKPNEDIFEAMSLQSHQTSDLTKFSASLRLISLHNERLWEEMTKRRRSRANFDVQIRKRKYFSEMGRFLCQILSKWRQRQRPLVIMGSANIHPNMKHLCSAPIIQFREALALATTLVMANEGRTSIIDALTG